MSAICDAHKKKVGIKLLYNLVHRKFNQLERRCWNEDQIPERLGSQAPSWAAQENRKETLLWPEEWGSICCSSVPSPTPSHSKTFSNPFEPFQIKWEVYFYKRTVSLIFIVSLLWFCMHMCMYSGHGYTMHSITVFLIILDNWESISAPTSLSTFKPSKLTMFTSNSWLGSFTVCCYRRGMICSSVWLSWYPPMRCAHAGLPILELCVTANWLKSLNGTLFSHVWRRGRLALDPLQK